MAATILLVALAILVFTLFGSAGSTWILLTLMGFNAVMFLLFWASLRNRQREFEESKDEFVSLVSHQLRTPLTSMRLFVEMLLDNQIGELNAKQHEYLRMVEISTGRMVDLVSDFLSTSRFELRRMEIKPEPAHIEDIVLSHVQSINPLANQQRVTVVYNKPELPEAQVVPNLYGQIVNNLLSNALHYTPEGGTVTVSVEKNKDGFQLNVADTGIGIPAEAQAELFTRFFRADNAKHVVGEGSGLGLYLVKRILDSCGGTIWYETTEGKGTHFHVIIPLIGMQDLYRR